MKNHNENSEKGDEKRGPGRPSTRNLTRFRRESQKEFRAWVKLFSDGKGIGFLSSDVQTLLRTARLIRQRLLELEGLNKLSDNQIKLTGTLAGTLSRLLNQVDKLTEEK